ncbi:unnamed protein product [Rotaria sp. Silwood2]|nr:unnamed protein product [Rotaria sp. Silwood2]
MDRDDWESSTSFSSKTEKFTELENNDNKSRSISLSQSYLRQSQSKKLQNYFHYRSAEYQQVNNHSYKHYSFSEEQTNYRTSNSNEVFRRPGINMNNGQDNFQEYCRYRNVAQYTPRTVRMSFLFKLKD